MHASTDGLDQTIDHGSQLLVRGACEPPAEAFDGERAHLADLILARLRGLAGAPPGPEAILHLKVCDPAFFAFLVVSARSRSTRAATAAV